MINVCGGGVCDVFVLEYDCIRQSLSIDLLDLEDVCMIVVW